MMTALADFFYYTSHTMLIYSHYVCDYICVLYLYASAASKYSQCYMYMCILLNFANYRT